MRIFIACLLLLAVLASGCNQEPAVTEVTEASTLGPPSDPTLPHIHSGLEARARTRRSEMKMRGIEIARIPAESQGNLHNEVLVEMNSRTAFADAGSMTRHEFSDWWVASANTVLERGGLRERVSVEDMLAVFDFLDRMRNQGIYDGYDAGGNTDPRPCFDYWRDHNMLTEVEHGQLVAQYASMEAALPELSPPTVPQGATEVVRSATSVLEASLGLWSDPQYALGGKSGDLYDDAVRLLRRSSADLVGGLIGYTFGGGIGGIIGASISLIFVVDDTGFLAGGGGGSWDGCGCSVCQGSGYGPCPNG